MRIERGGVKLCHCKYKRPFSSIFDGNTRYVSITRINLQGFAQNIDENLLCTLILAAYVHIWLVPYIFIFGVSGRFVDDFFVEILVPEK